MRTLPFVVVQTWYRRDGRYEVLLASDYGASTSIRFFTSDTALYERALAIEGQEIRVEAEWHADGAARILDALQEVRR